MGTIFAALRSAAAAPLASADAASVNLAACVAVVCVADSADGLPSSLRRRFYNGQTCCSRGNLCC